MEEGLPGKPISLFANQSKMRKEWKKCRLTEVHYRYTTCYDGGWASKITKGIEDAVTEDFEAKAGDNHIDA